MKQAILLSIAFVILSLSIIGCNNESSGTESTNAPTSSPGLVFDKLIGTWTGDGKSYERWTKNADGTFRSVVFSVKGSDTSWNEEANIYPENNQWIFENLVKGQNEGKSIKFTSIFVEENSVQFSNPAHDFPTDVNYTVADNNTVHAFIVGPNNKGGKDTIPINYKRVM